MRIRILIFGQLTDVINSGEFTLTDITDTNALLRELNSRYPELTDAKYRIAVDQQMVSGNVILKDGSTVALLPPFSGG